MSLTLKSVFLRKYLKIRMTQKFAKKAPMFNVNKRSIEISQIRPRVVKSNILSDLLMFIFQKRLNKPSQLGTKKVPHGGQHFWKPYGGF